MFHKRFLYAAVLALGLITPVGALGGNKPAATPETAAKEAPWKAELSRAILEGRCTDAKTIALKANDLNLAEQALRLCVPNDVAKARPSDVTGTSYPSGQSSMVVAGSVAAIAGIPATGIETKSDPVLSDMASVLLPANTSVLIEIRESVNSRNRVRGDKFPIALAAPIVIDGKLALKSGARGWGEVVYAEPGGMGGKAGKLVLAARYLEVNGTQVRLKALNLSGSGAADFWAMQGAAAAIGVGALFIGGKNMEYPEGYKGVAKIAEDVTVPLVAAAK